MYESHVSPVDSTFPVYRNFLELITITKQLLHNWLLLSTHRTFNIATAVSHMYQGWC